MADLIGVIGLGSMGLPMAQTLARRFRVVGYDVDAARRGRLAESAPDVASLCQIAQTLLLSLPGSPQVEAVMQAARPHLRPGALVIDTSTADPASTRALQAELAAAGVGLVDAPVSGGAAGAEAGQLLVMVGGEEKDIERAGPVLEPLARAVVPCGGPGAGNVVKLINNLLCAAQLVLAGEALGMADRAGIEPEALLAALNQGSGRSAVTEVNLPRWVLSGTFDSGFTMGLMRKDVALATELGVGPLSRAAAELWRHPELPDDADFNRMVALMREARR